jgi:DNA topoisomerase-3
MRLIIAEKPSLARTIGAGIDGEKKREKTCIRCANGDVIAWSAGHILGLKMPEDYNPDDKQWRLDALPHIPTVWENIEKPDKEGETYLADLRKTIKELLSKADLVVNAGDAGREGQLLIDELLEFYGYRGKALRLWLENTTPEHVKSRLAAMKDNEEYKGLYRAGQARTRADWLLGLNLTRVYTLLAQENGYRGTPLTIGRVQTPVLGLIVGRDREIENFVSKPFWTLDALLAVERGAFKARWKPQETQKGLDEEGRIIDASIVQSVADKVKGKTGVVADIEKKKKKQSPPLPYSLSSLQIDCSRSFDLSPADTLAVVQKLYEFGLVTYPRSDCAYIPEDQHKEAANILQAAGKNLPALANPIKGADTTRKSAAWNDKKIGEHYAIIPTSKTGQIGDGENEKRVYEKIALRYILQFWPDFEYNETVVSAEVEGEPFAAKGREILQKGWRDITADPDEDEEKKGEELNQPVLPVMEKGEAAKAESVEITEKKTTPPKRFTEAGIIEAMCGIHRYVSDPEIKKQLREEDGIGTEATRAEIIKALFLRKYVEKKGKQVISTEKGRGLIDILPDSITKPDLTALWERDIKQIHDGTKTLDEFVASVAENIRHLIEHGKGEKGKVIFKAEKSTAPSGSGTVIDTGHPCFKCKTPLQPKNGKNGPFWACPNPECKATFDDKNGKPDKPQSCPQCKKPMRKMEGKNGVFWACKCGLTLSATEKGKPQKTAKCPKCKGVLKQISGKKGLFWACSNPECKATFDDADNKPALKDKAPRS